MLGKLLKYDFRALNRVMLPLQGSVLLAGIIGSFLINVSYRSLITDFSYSYSSSSYSSRLPFEEILNATTMMISGLFFAMVFASFWVTLFLIAQHFYKSFLKDEGYLSFTLPVTTNKNLLSKIIAASTWVLINLLILCLVVILLSLVGFTETGVFNTRILEFYGEALQQLANAPGAVFIIEIIVLSLLIVLNNVLQIYTALVIGASIARTHKVIAGIGIYVACSFAMQSILSIATFGSTLAYNAPYFSLYSEFEWFYAAQTLVIPPLIVYTLFMVFFFLVSKHLLKTKLNLD